MLCTATVLSTAAGAERSFDIAIVGEASAARFASPRVLRVAEGESVRVRLVSDTAGEVHLHGYRLEARVAPGILSELAFIARATGRFRLEWHPAGAAGADAHHGPALAILEVHPK